MSLSKADKKAKPIKSVTLKKKQIIPLSLALTFTVISLTLGIFAWLTLKSDNISMPSVVLLYLTATALLILTGILIACYCIFTRGCPKGLRTTVIICAAIVCMCFAVAIANAVYSTVELNAKLSVQEYVPYEYDLVFTENATGYSVAINTYSNDGSLAYTRDQESVDYINIEIPSEYNGKPITEIPAFAFSGCWMLESITIPESVTSIGEGAFRNCTSLKSVSIPSRVKSISKYAFYNCKKLSNIVISEGTTLIEEGAFENCRYFNIVVPKSVTYIQRNAFKNCYYSSEIYYCGSEADWSNVTVRLSKGEELPTLKYYSESKPVAIKKELSDYWYYSGGKPTLWG